MKHFLYYFALFSFMLSAFPLSAQLENEEPAYHVKSIFFGGGSYYIDEQQSKELEEFLNQFDPIEEYEIFIQSHTDNIGSADYNNWLSNRRGEMTKFHITEQGIPQEIISKEDFGEYSPDFDNETWEGRQRNRRVDVIIRRIVF